MLLNILNLKCLLIIGNHLQKIKSFFKIIRPVNILITFLSVIVAGILALESFSISTVLLLAALSESAAFAAGNVINDIFDIEIDKINRPDRVLPKGDLSRTSAIIIYLFLIVFSTFISFKINITVFIFIAATNVLLFLYSAYIKKLILFDNFLVAVIVGSAFLVGASSTGNIGAGIIPFGFALLITMAREILKDIEDIKGDISAGLSNFPYKFGIEKSKKLISFFVLILIGFTFYPYLGNIYNLTYLVFILLFVNPLLIYFLFNLFKNDSMENLRRLSTILKVDMIFGLAAIYFGIVN